MHAAERMAEKHRDSQAPLGRDEQAALLIHDLKNPLAVIRVNAEYLETTDCPRGEIIEVARDIRQAAEVMNRMVMNLLDVARAESGALVPQLADLDVPPLVAAVESAMRTHLHEAGQTLVASIEPLPSVLRADPELVRRILENIVENATKYAPRGSTIRLTVGPSTGGTAAEIRVADQGPGIPPQHRQTVFQKYVRLDPGEAGATGRTSRGMGLAFCRLAVEAHGGQIWIEDNQPTGCAFCVRLPLAETARPGGSRGAKTILVVEDDEDIREELRAILEDAGFRTLAAANGREALDLLERGPAHLVLLDWMMPVMSGQEFLRAEQRPDVPVVVLTAGGPFHSQGAEVRAWIRKPLSVAELVSTVRKHVS